MKNKHAQLKLFTLFSLLLLFCTFESMAQEKLITINVKNVSLKEIFNIIENQTPYRFSYRSVVLDADRKHFDISGKYFGHYRSESSFKRQKSRI